jgi:hypothetical protein
MNLTSAQHESNSKAPFLDMRVTKNISEFMFAHHDVI